MKYIKTYENIIEPQIGKYYLINYKTNLLTLPYNAKVISKVKNTDLYIYQFIDKRNKIHTSRPWSAIDKNDIIRKLTPEEIEHFNMIISAKEYNL